MKDYERDARRKGFHFVVGVDEAGRGPLAGPVVASAVVLHDRGFRSSIRDSKKLTSRQRQEAFEEIGQKATVGIGIISEIVIDQINILQATFLAMHNAIQQAVLKIQRNVSEPGDLSRDVCLLVDGKIFRTDLPYAYCTVIQGDDSVLPIMCASIVAKVTRDRILGIYDQVFPEYGFKNHKGYGTRAHREAIRKWGPSLIHRRSFAVS